MSEAHKTGIFSSKGAEAPNRIIGIQFSMLSPEEIRKSSVAEITSRDTYVNNRPVIGGLFDPRMGVLEPGLICPTDGLNYMQTPGYFGHIELARPVYYIQYLTQLMKTLRCICFRCSKLLISKEQHRHILEWDSKKRWEYVFSHANIVKRCGDENDDGCGCQQPNKIYKEGLATLFAKWKFTAGDTEENTKIVKVIPEIALKILGRMTDDDIQFMGYSPVFSRPESMICQVLAVPPPAVRPSVKHDAQQRSEDDLTHILVSVVKANRTLQEKMTQTDENGNGVDPKLIDDWTTVLQYFVATMVNNKLPGVASITQRSGRAFKSIIERLNGKHGRVRGNLMGKRVDFSARSVITPDANLSIRQLGVPMKIAMNLTQPVVVNSRNRAFLNQLVINGPEVYPGAKILEKKNGDNISLRHVDRESLVLDNGDTVHRHMMDGDIVLFNRQPTLHRMSMMGHEVKVMREGNTFRMNVADTKPYNADFDGDEMNLHAPQDDEAAAELRNLAAVPRQMISPANNSSIVGIFQDSLLGAYRFTREGIQFTPRQAMNLLMCFPGIKEEMFVDPERNVTNFEILSQFLPAMSTYFTNGGFEEGENKATSNNVIDIKNGKYLRGQLDKGALGSGSKGLIQRIFNDFGFQKSADFIDYLQGIVNEYMKQSGYSVGISDLIADSNTNRKIADAITRQKQEAMNIIQELHVGVFENNTGKSNYEEFETRMNGILNKAREEGGKIGRKSLSKDNRFVIMVNAGSKGNNLNIVQMISCLGQQNVDGKRIPYGLEARTLPHYPKYDDSPSARGFVETSFVQGLSPQELFFHAMGGREGLIDTAVKTSKTGYIQRRLIKGLEDMKVAYDMTVRNGKNKIVQFAYGDDGMDSTKVENQVLPLTHMSIEQIYAHFLIPEGTKAAREMIKSVFTSDVAKRLKKESKEYNQSMKQLIDEMVIIRDTMHTNVFERMNDKKVHYPVHLRAILGNVEQQLHLTSTSQCDLTLLDALRMVDEEFKYLNSMRYTKPTPLFKALFYYYLNPKELLVIRRFHRQGLETLLLQIRTAYMRSVVAPGEMVGLVAAQSIGEPTTQLTLNSFVYETKILVRNKQKEINQIQIGDFVKHLCEHSMHNQEYYREKDTTYAPVQKEDFWEIQAPDKYGNIDWYKIEAGTKHPVINEDGTNTMLKVITEDGQEVIATKAKSFLLLKNGQLEPTRGDELTVGDYVPVSIKTISHKEKDTPQTKLRRQQNYIPNLVNGKLVFEKRGDSMKDVIFVKVKTIEEVNNTTDYAYDLTVEKVRTFVSENGLCLQDTFHFSGISSKSGVTRGVPRIEEILALSENPKNPSMTVYLKEEEQQDQERVMELMHRLEHTSLRDVTSEASIYFDPSDEKTRIEEDAVLMKQYNDFKKIAEECMESSSEDALRSKWVIRFKIDREQLLERNITMDDIYLSLQSAYKDDIDCIYSDMNANNLVMRVRTFQKGTKSAKTPIDTRDEIYKLKAIQDMMLDGIILRGIRGIGKVMIRKIPGYMVANEGGYESKDIWVLDTMGTNLMDILANSEVDTNRTLTNDLMEVYRTLGIEAVRQVIYNEFAEVLGGYINYHHLSMLCDRMTMNAKPTSIFRHGINNDDIGTLAKASFEETPKMFLESAMHGELDPMSGVSANVMCGQEAGFGTGLFDLVLDTNKMTEQVKTLEKEDELDSKFQIDDPNDPCSIQSIQIHHHADLVETKDLGTVDDDYDAGF
jgi:DNA-directed RNA polymerase II subunit RPB1